MRKGTARPSPGEGHTAILWAGMLLLAAACARSVPVADAPDRLEAPEETGEIVIHIDNQHFQQATVIAHLGGRRIRLGEFEGKTRRIVRLDWEDRELYFEVRLLADNQVRYTPRIRPYNDEVLEILIDPATGRVHLRR